jgi:predicted RNA-binding Zn-ribbon protein involved in translation (DUF1610 family)
MVQILSQAVEATPDLASYVGNVMTQLMGIDVLMVLRLVGVWLFLIWIVFALWVALDATARYKQWPMAFAWFLFVLPFNVFGFIGYLFMRPVVTLEDKQWTKLESKYLMYELSNVNDCPTCGTIIPAAQNFCAACGTQMNMNCPKCESLQSIYNNNCTQCGEKLRKDEVVVVKEEPAVAVAVEKPLKVNKLAMLFAKAKTSVSSVVNKAKIDTSKEVKQKVEKPAKSEKAK